MFDRIAALIIKELTALWNDRKTRFVILIPPLIQVVLFSYAATYDVSHVPLGIWNEDRGALSAELVRRFAASPAFEAAVSIDSPAQLAAAIDARQAAAVLHVPQNFSADVLAGRQAHVQLVLDGRRSNTALLIDGYASAIVTGFAQERQPLARAPVDLAVRDWFNPTLESQWFILPGLVCVLTLLMTMMVSALSLARERELGTFEQLLVTPLRPFELLLGKALPGIVVGMIDAVIVTLVALLWFRVPFLGGWALLAASLLLYTIAGAGLGLAISSVTHTQQQAMLGVFLFGSPIVVTSGYAAPVENMPAVFELLSRADPMRWMLIIVRGLFLQDMPASVVLHYAWPLAMIAAVTFGAAVIGVRRAVS